MKRTIKQIAEMNSFIKIMSVIYKDIDSEIFNNLQAAIDEIEIEESEQEIIDKYLFQLQKNEQLNEIIKDLKNGSKKTK